MHYESFTDQLAPLEEFDAKMFAGSDEYPQEVCDLILAVAVGFPAGEPVEEYEDR